MVRVIRNKTIFKAAGLAVLAAIFCIGCGDKDKDGDTSSYCAGQGLAADTAYVITFNATGGTVTPTSVIAPSVHGSCEQRANLLTTPWPTREGYTFHGWYTAATGGSLVEAGRASAVFVSDDTLYAHWTLNRYKITFDAHGGTVTPAYDTTGDAWTLDTLPTPERDNHTFDGWYTDIVGIGDKVKVTESKVYRENTTIYAHWIYSGVHYTVTFDATGGTVDPPTEETDVGGKLEDLPLPEREGYAFRGWFTAAEGGSEVTTNTAFDKATTVYAHWTFITDKMYIVTFDAHGGTVAPKSGVTGEDGKLLAALPVPVREGYTFLGWFSEDGAVTAGTVFTANTGVHAQWKIIHYEITFDAMGGTVTPASGSTGSHWELMDDLPVPVREGYTFIGWYTSAAGGTEVTPTTPLMGNITVYAHWTLSDAHFTITFNAMGGTVTPASAETGDDYRLASLPAPARDGYAFNGWFTAETGGTVVTHWTAFEADATVYAHWVSVVDGVPVTYGGETYRTEVIGSQTWFARNLNYEVAGSKCYGQDGVVFVEVRTDKGTEGYYDTLSDAEVEANCGRYGRLYDWEAAKSACPAGWHLPSDDDWTVLTDYVGGGAVAGRELRSASTYWEYNSMFDVAGADDYGFSALPGGEGRYYTGGGMRYFWAGKFGWWWSSTAMADDLIWARDIAHYDEHVNRRPYDKRQLYSVRCVKD